MPHAIVILTLGKGVPREDFSLFLQEETPKRRHLCRIVQNTWTLAAGLGWVPVILAASLGVPEVTGDVRCQVICSGTA